MVAEGTVRRLLQVIERRVARLQSLASTPLESYLSDADLQDVVERNFELAIQAALDLGLHILADRVGDPPESNRAVIRRLVDEGVVDPGLGPRLEAMVGFRNVLVRGYAGLMPENVHAYLSEVDDLRAYVGEVVEYLMAHGLFEGSAGPGAGWEVDLPGVGPVVEGGKRER